MQGLLAWGYPPARCRTRRRCCRPNSSGRFARSPQDLLVSRHRYQIQTNLMVIGGAHLYHSALYALLSDTRTQSRMRWISLICERTSRRTQGATPTLRFFLPRSPSSVREAMCRLRMLPSQREDPVLPNARHSPRNSLQSTQKTDLPRRKHAHRHVRAYFPGPGLLCCIRHRQGVGRNRSTRHMRTIRHPNLLECDQALALFERRSSLAASTLALNDDAALCVFGVGEGDRAILHHAEHEHIRCQRAPCASLPNGLSYVVTTP